VSRPLVALCLLLAAGLGAAGWTLTRTARPPAELRFVNGSEPKTLDPGLMTGNPEGRIADALFEGLTVRDPETLRPVPGVASAWTVSEDGLRFVFELRREARWSDGRPVTAHDFVYAWRRLEEPAFGSEYAYLLHGVRHAEAYNAHGAAAEALAGPVRAALEALAAEAGGGGVPAARWQRFAAEQHLAERLRGTAEPALEALLARRTGTVAPAELARAGAALAEAAAALRASADAARAHFGVDAGVFADGDHRLVVELRAPLPYFLELTAFYPTYPVPSHVLERAEPLDWFLPGKIVSNGPFRLAEWRVGERIRLERSETYWDRARIRLASADALPIENATTALNLYLAGEADWIPSPSYPPDLVDDLRARPDFYANAGNVVYYYRLNCTRPPFDDARVREALALAIDREALVRDVLRLGQIPAFRIVPPGVPGYRPPESALRHDPERARALLAAAGYGPGRPFPPVGLVYNTAEIHKQIAEVVADQLRRELGIEVRAYNQEWQAYQASTLALDYDMSRAAWIGDYLDPNSFLDLWVSGGGNNQTGWGDARYDAWIRAAGDVEGFARAPGAALAGLREPGEMAALLAAAAAAQGTAARRDALGRVRMQLFREAEALLFQEAYPVLPVYFYVVSGLVSPRVGGFHSELVDPDGTRRPNLQDLHPLRGMWVRDAPATGGGR
jgi:oligopeptide transport system substrate-binding protein